MTIPEILVMVNLGALLVVLALPALNQADETAKAAKCMDNLKRIYAGLALYAEDNRDYFPYQLNWQHTLGRNGYVGKADAPFGPNTTTNDMGRTLRWPVFFCPAEKGAKTSYPGIGETKVATLYDTDFFNSSYALNSSVNANALCEGSVLRLRKFSDTPDCQGGAASAPIIMDYKSIPKYEWDSMGYMRDLDERVGSAYTNWLYAFRHPGEQANVLYLDGHVDAIRHFVRTGKMNWVSLDGDEY